jgi:hypothetical protein
MPYDDDLTTVADALRGGSCPYCGQAVSAPPAPLGELEHN